ncbi:uncharacterized protein LOC122869850 [Xyrichtys novacula]|uniref:Uncharacterized protein LOC122869850 n=1 Tax=Xyrichtys novacula TaxID=13765 RepID=A0AAV1HMC1_XYRNO|nr:uncharacterized protein LOC122869850 [Xyrichtys novacula]
MMTSLKFLAHLMSVFLCGKALTSDRRLTSSVRQESSFISANVGDNVTLQCFYEGNVGAMLFWYKQAPGQEPRLICSFYRYDRKGTFSEEFEDNTRFVLETQDSKNHLIISDLLPSDSATYFCVSSYAYEFQFAEGTTVSVKGSGSNVPAVVYQSASENILLGELNCTVQVLSCTEEHSVYWFRNSEEPQPGLIYTHGGKNDQCERKSNTETNTCIYKLPTQSMNLTYPLTLYCAFAVCGHILFGNGTKLDSAVYVTNKRRCRCTESQRASDSNTTSAEDTDNLHYAALKDHGVNRARTKRNNTRTDCVYSMVRQ